MSKCVALQRDNKPNQLLYDIAEQYTHDGYEIYWITVFDTWEHLIPIKIECVYWTIDSWRNREYGIKAQYRINDGKVILLNEYE